MERAELNKLIENCCDNIGKHYTSSDAWLEIVKLIDEYEEVKNLTMKRIYRHKAITEKGETFRQFSTKAEIEEYIESQIESRGLDWRAGYLIRFRDGLQLDFVKMNGDAIKT